MRGMGQLSVAAVALISHNQEAEMGMEQGLKPTLSDLLPPAMSPTSRHSAPNTRDPLLKYVSLRRPLHTQTLTDAEEWLRLSPHLGELPGWPHLWDEKWSDLHSH